MGFSPDSAYFRRGAPKKFWSFEIVFHWSNLAKLAFYPNKCDKMCDICRRISRNYVPGFFFIGSINAPKYAVFCPLITFSNKISFHG